MLRDPARGVSPRKRPPLGGLFCPEEGAALVAFLLSDDDGHHRIALTICGGASLPP